MATKPASSASGTAAAETPELKLARTLGRILWDREFKAANPGATPQAKQAAWNAAKRDYIKMGRQVSARLAKAGFSFTASEKA